MPSFFPEGDAPVATDPSNKSLQKINSLLQSIDSKTGSTTITGPVTVSNEVEVKNDSGNPVPVNDAGGSLTVDGSVSVSNLPASYPVTDNGGSLTVDGTVGISGTVPVSGTFWQTTQPVSDAGGSLTVDGSVSVSNFPATQPVSGSVTANAGTGTFAVSSTQLPTALVSDRLKVDGSGVTQPVSGSISVSNFPATQAVTGTFWQATQPISGTVTANTGLSQPLTDTQLRATAVPVSGPLTDTQLRATAVPVSGTFWQSTQPVSDAGGSLTIDGLVGLDGSIPSTPFYTFTTSTTFPSSWITPAVDVSSYSEVVLFITGQSGASGLIGFQGEYVVGSGYYVSMSYSRISANHSVTFYPNGSTNAANGFNIATIGFGKLFTAGFKTLRLNALSSVSGTWTVSLYGRKISPIEPGHPLFGLDAQKLNHFVFSNNRLQVEASQVGTYAVSGTVNVNNSIAADLKTQAQILDASGNQLTYAATGTAGTPASDVVTVQGIASGTAVAIRPRHAAVSVVTGTTANTSSNSVLAQNTTRQYLLFQNLSDTDMNINFGAAASSSTMLIPKNGGGIVFETGFVPTDAVELICTASSKAYYILHA